MPLTVDEQRLLLSGRTARRPAFRFSSHETDHVATLITGNQPFTYPHPCPKAVADGLERLLDRGLIALDTSPGQPGRLRVRWSHPAAEASAARHLLRYFSHGAFMRNTILNRITRGTTHQFSRIELSIILSWHYRFTGIHSLTFDQTGQEVTVTEHHWTGLDTQQTVTVVSPSPERITTVGDDEYADAGEVLNPDTYAVFVSLYAQHSVEQGAVTLNLDTLHVTPAGAAPTFFTDTLPGLTQDALMYLQAPAFARAAEFIGWAEKSLLLAVPCGTVRHRLALDPHTHRLAPYPVNPKTEARHAGEHLLTAFTDDPETGCQRAQWWVNLFGNEEQYNKAWTGHAGSALAAVRIVARTVQYLDAGINLAGAASFVRLGLRADQAATVLRLQQDDPHAARRLLIEWHRHHWVTGPERVDAITMGEMGATATA